MPAPSREADDLPHHLVRLMPANASISLPALPSGYASLNRYADQIERAARKSLARNDAKAICSAIRNIRNTERQMYQLHSQNKLSDRQLLKLAPRLETLHATLSSAERPDVKANGPYHYQDALRFMHLRNDSLLDGSNRESLPELSPQPSCHTSDDFAGRNETLATVIATLRSHPSIGKDEPAHWTDRLLASNVQPIPRAWSNSSGSSSPAFPSSGYHSRCSFDASNASWGEDETTTASPSRSANDAGSMTNYFSLSSSDSGTESMPTIARQPRRDSYDSVFTESSASSEDEVTAAVLPSRPDSRQSATAGSTRSNAGSPEDESRHASCSSLPRMNDKVHTEALPNSAFGRRILDGLASWLRKALRRKPNSSLLTSQRVYLGGRPLPTHATAVERRQTLFNDFWAGHYDAPALASAVLVSAENALLAHGRMVEPDESRRLQIVMLEKQRSNPPPNASADKRWMLDVLIAQLKGEVPSRQCLIDACLDGAFRHYDDLRDALVRQVKHEQPALDVADDLHDSYEFSGKVLKAFSLIEESPRAQRMGGEAIALLQNWRDQLEQEIAASVVHETRFGIDPDPRPAPPTAPLQPFELPDGRRIRV